MNAAINIDFPFGFAFSGRTATCDNDAHVRDLIEQLLFTRPGERVNRPNFGAGLMHAVFGAAGAEAALALEMITRAALHRELGDIIEIQVLSARAEDAALIVDIRYSIRRTGEHRVDRFAIGGPA